MELSMSKYEEQYDDVNRVCPYCSHEYRVEAENYSEDLGEETCGECGMKFWGYESFSVACYATPDCELNGKAHVWGMIYNGGHFCKVCNKCEVIKT
jgi:hypothetical protein